jgi:hypothetical protein
VEFPSQNLAYSELLSIEDSVWVLTAPTDNPNYDFRFADSLKCRHPWQPPENITAVARVGAIPSYDLFYEHLRRDESVTLVNNPTEQMRASDLPQWYPSIEDLTPRSIWSDKVPDVATISDQLGWPIFMKGSRQTSRHQRALSIIEGPEQFEQALAVYSRDPLLRWQRIICREFIRLRLVEDDDPRRLPAAFEFRTFWWKGELAGCGRYWWEGKPYRMTPAEESGGLAVAGEAAQRMKVPFLVIDIAQAQDGRWLVIECNDAQESGYAGVTPVALWQRIAEIEKRRSAHPRA